MDEQKFFKVDDLLKIGHFTVLNFRGSWCNNCVAFEPIFRKAAEEYKKKGVTFALIDAETCYAVLDELNIHELPTLVFCKDKEVKFQHTGRVPLEELKSMIEKLLCS